MVRFSTPTLYNKARNDASIITKSWQVTHQLMTQLCPNGLGKV